MCFLRSLFCPGSSPLCPGELHHQRSTLGAQTTDLKILGLNSVWCDVQTVTDNVYTSNVYLALHCI